MGEKGTIINFSWCVLSRDINFDDTLTNLSLPPGIQAKPCLG
jgi:hypothetical protein